MRVLHVIEAPGHGTGRHIVDLARLVPAEHHVVAPAQRVGAGSPDTSPTHARLREAGATITHSPMRRLPVHPGNVVSLIRLDRIVRSWEPDLVHGHAAIGGALARILGRRLGLPVVYTPHGFHPARAARILERQLQPLTTRLVAVSASEADFAREVGYAGPDQIVVIPNGIEDEPPLPSVDPPDLRSKLGIPPDSLVVGTVGRAARQKGVDVLIGAAPLIRHRSPSVHIVIVGDGPQLAQLRRRVESSGLGEFVHLVGHIESAAALLPQFDVMAFPSRWEGGPYVPLEAMRASVPLVVSDCVGNRDLVIDGVHGRMVPVEDVRVLAAAVGDLLDDVALRVNVARAARQRLRSHFSSDAMARRTGRLYEEVLRTRRSY